MWLWHPKGNFDIPKICAFEFGNKISLRLNKYGIVTHMKIYKYTYLNK
jgi:hypothetical protein